MGPRPFDSKVIVCARETLLCWKYVWNKWCGDNKYGPTSIIRPSFTRNLYYPNNFSVQIILIACILERASCVRNMCETINTRIIRKVEPLLFVLLFCTIRLLLLVIFYFSLSAFLFFLSILFFQLCIYS